VSGAKTSRYPSMRQMHSRSAGCITSRSGTDRAEPCGYPWHQLWIAGSGF